MIDLYYWPTPNGHKITLFLEESGLPYRIVPVDISKGEQFKAEFLAFSPNNRMPAIIDRAPADDGEAVGVFESGAILVYLKAAVEWLFWQVGGLGPMAGQNHHFNRYAPEKISYAIERYVKETNRLYGVLDRRLVAAPYLAGKDYSIADIAVYPWIVPWEMQSQDLGHFPALKRWFDAIAARPATVRAYERGAALKTPPVVTDDSRKILFGQTAATGR